jgi:hypothetical protein
MNERLLIKIHPMTMTLISRKDPKTILDAVTTSPKQVD